MPIGGVTPGGGSGPIEPQKSQSQQQTSKSADLAKATLSQKAGKPRSIAGRIKQIAANGMNKVLNLANRLLGRADKPAPKSELPEAKTGWQGAKQSESGYARAMGYEKIGGHREKAKQNMSILSAAGKGYQEVKTSERKEAEETPYAEMPKVDASNYGQIPTGQGLEKSKGYGAIPTGVDADTKKGYGSVPTGVDSDKGYGAVPTGVDADSGYGRVPTGEGMNKAAPSKGYENTDPRYKKPDVEENN